MDLRLAWNPLFFPIYKERMMALSAEGSSHYKKVHVNHIGGDHTPHSGCEADWLLPNYCVDYIWSICGCLIGSSQLGKHEYFLKSSTCLFRIHFYPHLWLRTTGYCSVSRNFGLGRDQDLKDPYHSHPPPPTHKPELKWRSSEGSKN